jgi:hypothetical protein
LQAAGRRDEIEEGSGEREAKTVTGHRVQAAGFNLGPCILNLESPVGQREE